MNKEELIGKLQMVYVGDKNALNELIGYYDGLKEGIDELQQENQKYKEVIDKVINIAYEYGQIDGYHHKTWVIDQIIRELLGTEYDNFIKEYEEDGEYTWDIGIAP